MSPIWGHVLGGVTVLLLLLTCATWIWAWLPQHKKAYDALARLPMSDANAPDPTEASNP